MLSVELCSVRLFAPFLGSSLYVWSALIGVLLAMTALGATFGGSEADAECTRQGLAWSFARAAAAAAIVVPVSIAILLIVHLANLDLRLSALIAAIAVLAFPGITLGAIGPYALRLACHNSHNIGSRAGLLSAVSTGGSVLGTFLTGFFLFPILGSTLLAQLSSLLLIIAAYALGRGSRPTAQGGIALAVLFLLGCAVFAKSFALPGIADVDTAYRRALILESPETKTGRQARFLVTDPIGAQSVMYLDNPDELPDNYLRSFERAIRANPAIHSVLVLGGGAFILPRYLANNYPDLTVDVVELDPGITSLAERYFHLAAHPRLHILHGDARAVVAKLPGRYDLIVVDVFSACPEIPFHVATREAFEVYRAHLQPDGVLMLNVIAAGVGKRSELFRSLFHTVGAVFPALFAARIDTQRPIEESQNLLIGAAADDHLFPSRSSLSEYRRYAEDLAIAAPEFQTPLTDDFAPVEPAILPILLELQSRRFPIRPKGVAPAAPSPSPAP